MMTNLVLTGTMSMIDQRLCVFGMQPLPQPAAPPPHSSILKCHWSKRTFVWAISNLACLLYVFLFSQQASGIVHVLQYRYSGLNLQVWENYLLITRTNLLAGCRFLWPTFSLSWEKEHTCLRQIWPTAITSCTRTSLSQAGSILPRFSRCHYAQGEFS